MTEREPLPVAPRTEPGEGAVGEASTPRRVEVAPEDVWQPGAERRSSKPRWVEQSIFAPVLGVVLLSAVLLYGLLLALGLLVALIR